MVRPLFPFWLFLICIQDSALAFLNPKIPATCANLTPFYADPYNLSITYKPSVKNHDYRSAKTVVCRFIRFIHP